MNDESRSQTSGTRTVLADHRPAVRDGMRLLTTQALGMEIVGMGPDEYGAFLRAENAKWGKMVRDLKLRAD